MIKVEKSQWTGELKIIQEDSWSGEIHTIYLRPSEIDPLIERLKDFSLESTILK